MIDKNWNHTNKFEMYLTLQYYNFIKIALAEQNLCKIARIMIMIGKD